MGDRRSTAPPIKSRVNMRLTKLIDFMPSGALYLLVSTALAPVAALTLGLPLAHAADVVAVVGLSDQRVRLDEEKHQLTVEVTVHNALEVALTAVDVGWLLAADPKAVDAISDPGALYLDADDPKHVKPPPGVTVLRRNVEVAVPPRGRAQAALTVPLAGSAPEVYRTHVLGYALADASLPVLLRLLNGSAAADERAAVEFFALAGPASARLRARQALSAHDPLATELWLRALEPKLTAAVPQRPSASELHERLFVVRAVGVVGGPRAEELLTSLRDREDLASFDELLRVVLIDRLRGTRLETPLAFAVPPSARSFRDVVEVALGDAKGLAAEGRAGNAEGRSPSTDGREARADGRSPSTDGREPSADGRLPRAEVRDAIAEDRQPVADGRLSSLVEGDVVSESLLQKWWLHATGLAVVVGASILMTLFLRRKL